MAGRPAHNPPPRPTAAELLRERAAGEGPAGATLNQQEEQQLSKAEAGLFFFSAKKSTNQSFISWGVRYTQQLCAPPKEINDLICFLSLLGRFGMAANKAN